MPNDTFSFHDIVVTLVERLMLLQPETLRDIVIDLSGKEGADNNFLLDGALLALRFQEAKTPKEKIAALIADVLGVKP